MSTTTKDTQPEQGATAPTGGTEAPTIGTEAPTIGSAAPTGVPAQPAFPDCLKIPLVIGISGHIDINTPETEIEQRMEEFWTRLRELVPGTPFILLSSIAAGADHLAVKYRPKDVPYCAVLPFEETIYRNDFSGQTLVDYDNDLKGAYKLIDCQAEPGDYAPASDYIRKHSDILLTLWDGYESKDALGDPKKGGTYYQVLAAFKVRTPHLQYREKAHLVVNISVERKKQNAAYHNAHNEEPVVDYSNKCTLTVLDCDGNEAQYRIAARDFSQECARLEAIVDAASGRTPTREDILREETDAVPVFLSVLERIRWHNDRKNLPSSPESSIYLRGMIEEDIKKGDTVAKKCFDLIREDFLRLEHFDGIAMRNQTPYKTQFRNLIIWSVFFGVVGQLWGDFTFCSNDTIHEWVMHLLILSYLIGCWLLYRSYKKMQKENCYFKYIKPRLIAEMLRLKVFWKLAGIVDSFADSFLEECAGFWFMLAICNWELAEPPMPQADRSWLEIGNGFKFVKKFWVDDQTGYYAAYLLEDPGKFVVPEYEEKKKFRKKKMRFLSPAWCMEYFKKYERCEAYSLCVIRVFTWGAFILSFMLIVVFAVAQITKGFDHRETLKLSYYREFIVGICPFIVAAFGWIMEKFPWDQIAPQYREAKDLFEKTSQYLGHSHSSADRRQMIRELILFAHQENAEWNDIRNGAKPEPMI